MRLKNFFLMNYLTYIFIFLTQISIARLYGLNALGQFAIFQALMALLEAPIISGRSDSSIQELNKDQKNVKLIYRHTLADFRGTSVLSPLIFISMLYKFDMTIAILATLTVFVQSGYASSKNFLIVNNLRKQSTLIELTTAAIGLLLILAIAPFFKDFKWLVVYYLIFTTIKVALTSVYILKYSGISTTQQKNDEKSNYNSVPVLTSIRNLALNGMSNIDILLVSAMLSFEYVGMYKIVKTFATAAFRAIAPFWKWESYSINSKIVSNDLKSYRHSQLKGVCIALTMFLIIIPFFELASTKISEIAYQKNLDVTIIPTSLILLNTFLVLSFLSFFKIDMLYRENKKLTLGIPTAYCTLLAADATMRAHQFSDWIEIYSVFNFCFITLVSAMMIAKGLKPK